MTMDRRTYVRIICKAALPVKKHLLHMKINMLVISYNLLYNSITVQFESGLASNFYVNQLSKITLESATHMQKFEFLN